MSDSQWNYLGLSHNPFSDPQQEFFPGADRETLLGKVRKLSEWSRPILTVSGPHGVGKTCLFRALSSSLEAGVIAARVNGSLVSRAGDVLSALVQGYGVAAPAGAEAPLLIELIIAHLKDQTENDRTCLVLVDDAHLLEQRAVDDLVNLADAGAKLAFFSEPQFVESLQRGVERNAEGREGEELLWQEMLLSPFSREQAGEYLEWRFAEAGYNGRMPFSEYQVNGIHKTSEGFPGRLDFAANEQLMLMTVGGARSAGIPVKHLWLAGGLACVLGLTLWLWSPGEDLEVDKKTVKVELPKTDPSSQGNSSLERESQKASKVPTVRPAESASAPAPVPAPAIRPTISRTVKPVPSAERSAPKPVVNQSRTVRVRPETVPETVATAPQAKSAPKPQAAKQEQAETAAKVASTTVAAKPPEPKPQTRPATKPKTDTGTAGSGVRNASWLLAQSDSSYTIQLIGFSDADRASAYLQKQDQPSRFALFRTQSGERVVHVVTYGVYGTQAAAEAAAARLPGSIGKVTPWIRPIRSVKGAIQSALGINS